MTSAVHIPDHASAAHLERLLMRWPCSVRLKLKLQETRRIEAELMAIVGLHVEAVADDAERVA